METQLEEKLHRLEFEIARLGSVLVAFSGGVDSTLLAVVARRVLGPERMLAVTARSATYPETELEEARRLALQFDLPHELVGSNELDDPRFCDNPPERCYYCKLGLFGTLIALARERGLAHVADGTNADDTGDWRPGMRAAAELGVRQPLREAGLTKADVRALSAELGLPTHDKPPAACLASRFPYGTRITEEALRRVGRAEQLLKDLGFQFVRVRNHDPVARIELGSQTDWFRMLQDGIRERIVKGLKDLGFKYVALDLEGYRTGSLNEVLPQRQQ